jgi:hypothetical protein
VASRFIKKKKRAGSERAPKTPTGDDQRRPRTHWSSEQLRLGSRDRLVPMWGISLCATLLIAVLAVAIRCEASWGGKSGGGRAQSESKIHAVSVFPYDEMEYHQYSAILAATEPFRLQLNLEFAKQMNPLSYFINKVRGTAATQLRLLRSSPRLHLKSHAHTRLHTVDYI